MLAHTTFRWEYSFLVNIDSTCQLLRRFPVHGTITFCKFSKIQWCNPTCIEENPTHVALSAFRRACCYVVITAREYIIRSVWIPQFPANQVITGCAHIVFLSAKRVYDMNKKSFCRYYSLFKAERPNGISLVRKENVTMMKLAGLYVRKRP